MSWKIKIVKDKKIKIKKEKKIVEKPFNNGTMTTSSFFSFLRAALRAKSRFWLPAQECRKNARRPNQSSNKRLKWEVQCAKCENWFPDKEIKCDHIIGAGSLNSFEDLPEFCKRLFCEVDGYQMLCDPCHNIKSQEERKQLKEARNNV